MGNKRTETSGNAVGNYTEYVKQNNGFNNSRHRQTKDDTNVQV